MSVRERLRERLGRFLALLDADDRAALTIVGGTALALYELPATVVARPTLDIDVVIEAVTHLAWSRYVRRLEAVGFRHRADEDEPLCRYTSGDLVVDVMPTDVPALGSASRWYAAAVESRIEASGGIDVHVISPMDFLATKLDAWPAEVRSGGDPLASHDVEDIVSVLRGVTELLDEVRYGGAAVHDELRAGLHALFAADAGRQAQVAQNLPGGVAL